MEKNRDRANKSQIIEREIYQRLYHAREFINACYHQPLDLEQISRRAFFSPYHFLRLFRQAFHQTPHQYLTEKAGFGARADGAESRLHVR